MADAFLSYSVRVLDERRFLEAMCAQIGDHAPPGWAPVNAGEALAGAVRSALLADARLRPRRPYDFFADDETAWMWCALRIAPELDAHHGLDAVHTHVTPFLRTGAGCAPRLHGLSFDPRSPSCHPLGHAPDAGGRLARSTDSALWQGREVASGCSAEGIGIGRRRA